MSARRHAVDSLAFCASLTPRERDEAAASIRRDEFPCAVPDVLEHDRLRRPSRCPCSAACRLRSRRIASAPLCQSTPSYSAATRCSGHAKSSRRRSPLPSTISYCSSGIGRPPSIIASRPRSPSGTQPGRRPAGSGRGPRRCRGAPPARRPPATARGGCTSRCAARRPSVASARGRRRLRATSTAVHAGAVARPRSPIVTSGAPSRRCTTSPSAERSARPGGLEHV